MQGKPISNEDYLAKEYRSILGTYKQGTFDDDRLIGYLTLALKEYKNDEYWFQNTFDLVDDLLEMGYVPSDDVVDFCAKSGYIIPFYVVYRHGDLDDLSSTTILNCLKVDLVGVLECLTSVSINMVQYLISDKVLPKVLEVFNNLSCNVRVRLLKSDKVQYALLKQKKWYTYDYFVVPLNRPMTRSDIGSFYTLVMPIVRVLYAIGYSCGKLVITLDDNSCIYVSVDGKCIYEYSRVKGFSKVNHDIVGDNLVKLEYAVTNLFLREVSIPYFKDVKRVEVDFPITVNSGGTFKQLIKGSSDVVAKINRIGGK